MNSSSRPVRYWWMHESRPKPGGMFFSEAFWDFHLRYCDAIKKVAGRSVV